MGGWVERKNQHASVMRDGRQVAVSCSPSTFALHSTARAELVTAT